MAFTTDQVAAALAAQQERDRAAPRLQGLARLHDAPATHVVATNTNTNACAIYCPNEHCQCLILRANVAPLETVTDAPDLAALPGIPVDAIDTRYYAVPSMMHFENVGFSKTVGNGVKYLCCADCDLGPLGFMRTAPGHSPTCYLKVARLRYKVPPPSE
ncbi:hypothetical protein GGF31_005029 [Allomyces arbusculus]|nr:hypothetical protein GGF31_005029 [Allomyces arbusculus]